MEIEVMIEYFICHFDSDESKFALTVTLEKPQNCLLLSLIIFLFMQVADIYVVFLFTRLSAGITVSNISVEKSKQLRRWCKCQPGVVVLDDVLR